MRPLARWSLGGLIVAFSIYRLVVFRPLPLDSPGTLRPILYSFFAWFLEFYEENQGAFAAWSRACLVALFIPAILAALNYAVRKDLLRLPGRVARLLCSRSLFFIAVAACLVLCRYPTLLQNEFNPDEGQFVASAHKLFYDPNFFHAVDCGTSGPINVYPLMVPAILGLSPDFASSRLLVIAIIFLSAFLLYRSVALIAAEELARIAVLPFAGAFAVFQSTELLHYSSEHIPVLLIAIAIYLSVRVLRDPSAYALPIALLGLIGSAAFFAKMQSVPVVAAVSGVALLSVHATGHAGKFWRPAALFATGAIPLMIINAALCLITGVWKDFWTSYITANFSYADANRGFAVNLSEFIQLLLAANEVRYFLFTVFLVGAVYFLERMRRSERSEPATLVQLLAAAGVIVIAVFLPALMSLTIFAYIGLLAIGVIAGYFVWLCAKGMVGADPVRWFGLSALLASGAALFSVYKAHHPFIHYLLLLFLPLCMLVAWMLMRQANPPAASDAGQKRRGVRSPHPKYAFAALVIVLTVASQSYLWHFQDDRYLKNVAARIRAPEGDFIRSLASPNGRIFVWGWTVRPYLGSGHVSATRDTTVANCFRSYNLMTYPPVVTPTRASERVTAYNEKRILRDLRANPPELFIDAVGTTSWFLIDRTYYGFEKFPDIAAFVTANYIPFATVYDQRYFLRRDLAARRSLALKSSGAGAVHDPDPKGGKG